MKFINERYKILGFSDLRISWHNYDEKSLVPNWNSLNVSFDLVLGPNQTSCIFDNITHDFMIRLDFSLDHDHE